MHLLSEAKPNKASIHWRVFEEILHVRKQGRTKFSESTILRAIRSEIWA